MLFVFSTKKEKTLLLYKIISSIIDVINKRNIKHLSIEEISFYYNYVSFNFYY